MSPSQDGFRIELPEGNLDVHDLSVGDPAPDAPVVVGVWAMVAAGAVVVHDVPDFALVAGTPARRHPITASAARAASARALGKTLVHSDSTEYSRPILERAGLVRVSTTTPYRRRHP